MELSPLNPPPISEMGRLRFGGEFRPKVTEGASSPSLAPFFTSQHWRCVQRPHGQGGCRGYHFLLGQHLSQNLGLSPLTVTPGPGEAGWWEVSLQSPRPFPSPPPSPSAPGLGSPLPRALGRARAAWGRPGRGPGGRGPISWGLRAEHLQERPESTGWVISALSVPHCPGADRDTTLPARPAPGGTKNVR